MATGNVTSSARPGVVSRALTFVRFSHSVFALPFALGALFVAARGWPGIRLLLLVTAAMVAARTAAMAFNRLADWEFDKNNPRTAGRQHLLSKGGGWVLLASSSAAFVVIAAQINPLCFLLSPVALFIVFFYSLTKRFTDFSHFFLGLALAVSPAAAWIAATGRLEIAALILAGGVMFWVAGFDLVYATQDIEYDRKSGLRNLAARLGLRGALRLTTLLHLAAWTLFALFGLAARLGSPYWVALSLMAAILLWENLSAHNLFVAENGPPAEQVNRIFFDANALVGAIFLAGVLTTTLFGLYL